MRIISTCPSNTEMLAYLGQTANLVGVDDYSDWPADLSHAERLGSDLRIDIDAVERLKPDLVVASLSVPGMEKNIERLKERGLPHIVLNPKSLADIGECLLTLGKAVGAESEAEQKHQKYHRILESFKERACAVGARPRLYWEWWAKPVYTPGGGNWLSEISELAGASNVFAKEPASSVKTDWDDVWSRRPDHICLVWVGVRKNRVQPNLVASRPGWDQLPAVREGRIHVLDEPLYCRPSPRLLTGLGKLAALLHPGQFPDYAEQSDLMLDPD